MSGFDIPPGHYAGSLIVGADGKPVPDAGSAPRVPDDDPITVPIEASATLTQTQVIFAIGQGVAALAAVIGFLGLSETAWIVRLTRFLQSNEAVPLILVASWAVVSVALWYRNRRRAIERAVMAALLPDRVAKLTGKAHPLVTAAIEEAWKAKIIGVPTKTKGL